MATCSPSPSSHANDHVDILSPPTVCPLPAHLPSPSANLATRARLLPGLGKTSCSHQALPRRKKDPPPGRDLLPPGHSVWLKTERPPTLHAAAATRFPGIQGPSSLEFWCGGEAGSRMKRLGDPCLKVKILSSCHVRQTERLTQKANPWQRDKHTGNLFSPGN